MVSNQRTEQLCNLCRNFKVLWLEGSVRLHASSYRLADIPRQLGAAPLLPDLIDPVSVVNALITFHSRNRVWKSVSNFSHCMGYEDYSACKVFIMNQKHGSSVQLSQRGAISL